MHDRLVARTLALLAAATLSACGGGGSSNNNNPAPSTAPPVVKPTSGATAPASNCASVSQSAAGARRAPRAAGGVVPNRLYVTYHTASSRSPQSIDASVRATQSVDIGDFGGASHRVVTLPDGTDLTNAASTLRSTSGVVDVQPLHYRSLASDTEANDPFLREPDQWYLYRTSTDVNPATGNAAWNLTKGSLGIKVAVVDTGIDQSNIDLTQNLVKAETILSGVVTPNKAQDTNGHGTNVAGLAAAATNNNYGFAGEGYNVGLLAYKIFPDTTTTSDCHGWCSGRQRLNGDNAGLRSCR